MKESKVCLVSTVRNPGPSFESFLRYHLAIGFKRIYIFFDDPQETQYIKLAKSIAGVEAWPCDGKVHLLHRTLKIYPELAARMKHEHSSRSIQTRQMLNAALGRDFALKAGFDWIFHNDSDELIFNGYKGSIGKVMSLVPDEVDEIFTPNCEAVPQSMDIENPFKDVTLFKVNPTLLKGQPRQKKEIFDRYFKKTGRLFFHSYDSGKAAGRVRSDLYPNIHKFLKEDPQHKFKVFSKQTVFPVRARLEGLMIYHYANSGFDQFLTKYHFLGDFPNRTYNKFFLSARDAYKAGDFFKLKTLYREQVQLSDKTEIEKLVKAGYLQRNRTMSKIITQLLKD